MLKYDGDSEKKPTRPSQPSQARYIIDPPTEIVHQPLSPAAAAAVVRRPVPREGLAMYDLRDYTDDELHAELRSLGIAFPADTSTFATQMLIFNMWDMIRSAVAKGSQQSPEDDPSELGVESIRSKN